MTVYCGSTTSRSRPTTFMIVMSAGGPEHVPEPLSPLESLETPEDDTPDAPVPVDPGLPLVRPSRKRIHDEEHDGSP
jgi:hypothetical protein